MHQSNAKNSIVEHLAHTNGKYEASVEEVEKFMRSYFDEMFQIDYAFNMDESKTRDAHAYAQRKLATQESYWAHPTVFSDYWRPGLSWPSRFGLDDGRVFSVKQDMMGNFVAMVSSSDGEFDDGEAYLISSNSGELKIVNKFF